MAETKQKSKKTNLVIVESPTKAKTLERYLGPDFKVKASVGHIRDLPRKGLGVDVERNFEPTYEINEEKKKVVADLKSAYQKAKEVWLATDFDREGEAIAYHVAHVLGVEPDRAKRVTFTEITEGAVREAFANPRTIDLRLVGYNLSPLLIKKVRRGLSAGRVQSPALRLIVEREREIEAFVSEDYWTIEASLATGAEMDPFAAGLIEVDGAKLARSLDRDPAKRKKGEQVLDEAAAREHAANLERAAYRVAEVRRREVKRSPRPPFTTSTLQQEAARKLGFSTKRTMVVAQQLYEGVELPGEGQVGLITYHRTDSTNMAEQALAEIGEVVRAQYGERYALAQPRIFKTKSRGAQEAHEAIRPTKASRLPDAVAASLSKDQAKLYRLIWQRAVASQMQEAILDQVSTDIEGTGDGMPRYLLRATGQTVKFDGFRRVYFEGQDDEPDEDAESRLPELSEDQPLDLREVVPEPHQTQPPPRFTEASLVKELERLGIGRPSTYSSIVSNLIDREYVRLEERRFYAEDVGKVVIEKVLKDRFEEIVDYEFTARMESELDEIAEGNMRWTQVLDEFYAPFERDLEKAEQELQRSDITSEGTGQTCPECGEGEVVEKLGRFGKFLSCTRYPDCKYTAQLDGSQRPEPKTLEETCPECGKPLVEKVGRFGPFVGCSGYPDCRYIKREEKKIGVTCPKCGEGDLVVKRARRRGGNLFYGCNRYPACDFTVGQRPLPEPCPKCGSLVVVQKDGSAKCTNAECGHVIEAAAVPDAAAEAG